MPQRAMKVEWFFRFVPDCREKVKSNQQFMGCRLFLLFTSWVMSNSLQPHGLKHAITNSQSLLKLMSLEPVMPSNHLMLCHPLLLLPSVFPRIRVFSSESALHIRWQRIGTSTLASVLPMNIQDWFHLGIDWFDLLEVQGTLKNLLWHHNTKASIQ